MRMPRISDLCAATTLTLFALLQGFTMAPGDPRPSEDPNLVRIEGRTVGYREPGEFLDAGNPVNGPFRAIRAERPFAIMKRQVTRGEYQRCVAADACHPLDDEGDDGLPVIGVSWNDAERYAQWLSRETGWRWRLPTDREWALAAGSKYRDDAYAEAGDPANPSRRWLAVYDAEAARQQEVDPAPRPPGSFGANEHGVVDLAGNVWEWTSSCYSRHRRDPASGETSVHENCGVRIAEGRHRAFMIVFFRDPKAGACSVGIPPANLGMRLVREDRDAVRDVRDWLGL